MKGAVMFKFLMSKKEKEKEDKNKLRTAKRNAKKVIRDCESTARGYTVDRDRQWEDARKYLKEGKKMSARRSIQAVRARELLIDLLDKRRFAFEERVIKLKMAITDNIIIASLNEMTKLIKIDPDELAVALEETADKIEDAKENNSIWTELSKEDMLDAEYTDSEIVNSVDNLMKQLESEVGVEVRGAPVKEHTITDTITEGIGKGRERIQKLTEDIK